MAMPQQVLLQQFCPAEQVVEPQGLPDGEGVGEEHGMTEHILLQQWGMPTPQQVLLQQFCPAEQVVEPQIVGDGELDGDAEGEEEGDGEELGEEEGEGLPVGMQHSLIIPECPVQPTPMLW